MKNEQYRLVLRFCLLAFLLLPATVLIAQTSAPTPTEEALAIEGNLGFGYLTRGGTPSLEFETSAVFCPDQAIFVLDRDDEAEVRRSFNATDLGNGSWQIPDPETNQPVIVKVQSAASVYPADGTTATPRSIPVVSIKSVSIVPLQWPRCWRLRRNYACGVTSTCPGGCFSGYSYTQLRNHLICRKSPGSYCLDFLYPVCRLNRHVCRDCTGGIIASWLNYRYVCAVF